MSNRFEDIEGNSYELPGLAEIVAERIKQIRDKGYTPEHDLHHQPDELIAAGMSYAEYAFNDMMGGLGYEPINPPAFWPWPDDQWHPENSALENIVKSGAFLAAAYDRIEAGNGQ